jgi:hypothetical protein
MSTKGGPVVYETKFNEDQPMADILLHETRMTHAYSIIKSLMHSAGAETAGESMLVLLQILGPLKEFVKLRDPRNRYLKDINELIHDINSGIDNEPRVEGDIVEEGDYMEALNAIMGPISAEMGGGGKSHFKSQWKPSKVNVQARYNSRKKREVGSEQQKRAIKLAKIALVRTYNKIAEDVAKKIPKEFDNGTKTISDLAKLLERTPGAPKFSSSIPVEPFQRVPTIAVSSSTPLPLASTHASGTQS